MTTYNTTRVRAIEKLYEDFSKSRARQNVDDVVAHSDNSNKSETTHVFQALQYLRKVCNHPKLVLNFGHPEYEKTTKCLLDQKIPLSDIQHAAKLPALKQLLLDCGIGVEFSCGANSPVVNQHRALIFCQLKSMLDLLEEDLFKIHLPTVSYLRLDGSIPAANRYSVVRRFNNDPSIDVLLLTTQVGGLGLNLTGADTVIFVEHDWNPMVDLQAMDRAHRIGQKKVVNVYRLITKGTLEEKIMGLQKFKMTIANTVISQENSSLMSMGTEQLLDLFNLDRESKDEMESKTVDSKSIGISNLLESLPDLWDEKHYEIEYDLTNFLKTLKRLV
uniref:Helicase C-terminal domain-containing protein n=1 Tax=Strigamia maritima TaxID=126957 RepID=T1JBY2_STRMM